MISTETINEIKSRIDIVDVVSDFITLKKAGANYKALSPFTNEKTASFYVVPEKGIFKDFSSGKGGDAITFIMEHETIGYVEALKLLATKYGIAVDEKHSSGYPEKATELEAIGLAVKFATKHFTDHLLIREEGRSIGLTYLQERQINNRSIDKFKLGYAPNEWHSIEEEAIKNGFSLEILEKSGLVVKNEAGKVYDRFRSRVIFPISNIAGNVIGFGGRSMGKDLPKYINSPESALYRKGQVLYGLFESKAAIRKTDFAYLVEGYTDVISMHQSGYENVVASAGTALTAEQVKLLKRFTENITILFDGDAAGIRASEKGIDIILSEGLNVKVLCLPEGEDPDSFCRKNSSSVIDAFFKDNAKDFISYRINQATENGKSDPSQRAASIKDILASIAVIPDALKRMIYLQDLSKRTDIDINTLTIEIKKILLSQRGSKSHSRDATDSGPASSLMLSDIHTLSKGFVDSAESTLKLFEKEFMKVLLNQGFKKLEDGTYTFQYLFEESQDVDFVEPIHQEIVDFFKVEVAKAGIDMLADVFTTDLLRLMPKAMSEYCSQFLVQKHFISNGWDQNQITVGEEYDPQAAALKVILQMKLGILARMQYDNLQKCKILTSPEDQEEILEIHAALDTYKNDLASRLGRTVLNISQI